MTLRGTGLGRRFVSDQELLKKLEGWREKISSPEAIQESVRNTLSHRRSVSPTAQHACSTGPLTLSHPPFRPSVIQLLRKPSRIRILQPSMTDMRRAACSDSSAGGRRLTLHHEQVLLPQGIEIDNLTMATLMGEAVPRAIQRGKVCAQPCMQQSCSRR